MRRSAHNVARLAPLFRMTFPGRSARAPEDQPGILRRRIPALDQIRDLFGILEAGFDPSAGDLLWLSFIETRVLQNLNDRLDVDLEL